jgi:hypothetical protein
MIKKKKNAQMITDFLKIRKNKMGQYKNIESKANIDFELKNQGRSIYELAKLNYVPLSTVLGIYVKFNFDGYKKQEALYLTDKYFRIERLRNIRKLKQLKEDEELEKEEELKKIKADKTLERERILNALQI